MAEARQVTAALRPNPVLTLSGQTLDLLGSRFNASSPVGPNQFNAHTDFVLERGRKRSERIAVAAADKSLAGLELREIMRRIIFDVQSAFLDVQQAHENIALAEANLASLRGIVQVNEARVKGGDLAAVELERSRVAGLQYENAVEQARLTVDSKTRTLKVRSELNNISGRFRTEMFGRIRYGEVKEKLPTVPETAVLQYDGKSALYVRREAGAVRAAEHRGR